MYAERDNTRDEDTEAAERRKGICANEEDGGETGGEEIYEGILWTKITTYCMVLSSM